jgi:hypothetical protein
MPPYQLAEFFKELVAAQCGLAQHALDPTI